MRKILIALFLVMVMSSPAFALFTNGGFEDGNFNGWTMDYGTRTYGSTVITWGQSNNNLSAVMSASSANQSGQTLDVNPWEGTYFARINNVVGGYHATKISQTDTISAQDIANGAKLYVDWGAMLVEPSNVHPENSQPFFQIDVWAGTDHFNFYADATDHDASWQNAGNNGGIIWYKAGQYMIDLASYSQGTQVKVEMFVVDCGWGGHGAFAFLDGIGTVKPPNPTPEPATMLLLGLGLAGLAALRRKF